MLRHKCLDVLEVRRRHPFLASGTFSSAWRLELKTNKAHHVLRHKCKSIPVAKVTGIFVA